MKIFDFHAHSLNPIDFLNTFKLDADTIFPKAHSYITDHTNSLQENIDRTIREYDSNNIASGLISGPNNTTMIEQHPDRFFNSFRPPFDQADEFLTKFEEGVKSGTIHGLGELGLSYAGIKLDTEILYPYYEICEKYNIPVLFHTGLNGPNPTTIMPHWKVVNGDPLLLEPVLGSFSDLHTVIAHFGYPFVDHTIYMLGTYTNCYADLSVLNWAFGKKLYHRILEETVDAVGSERLLYGSDQMIWPQMISKSVVFTRSAPIDETDLENIFYNNAQRLVNPLE